MKKKILKIQLNAKCSDLCWMRLHLEDGTEVEGSGYVPEFFPGQHWGDYIELDIDPATGIITNWDTSVSAAAMVKQVKEM